MLTLRSYIYIFIYFDNNNKIKIRLIICFVKNKYWTCFVQRLYQQAWRVLWKNQSRGTKREQSEDLEFKCVILVFYVNLYILSS